MLKKTAAAEKDNFLSAFNAKSPENSGDLLLSFTFLLISFRNYSHSIVAGGLLEIS